MTYGRPSMLEEAIFSFLHQDYLGETELLVLNDLSSQTLVVDDPRVQIVNVPKRFHSIGEKRNASVALASHDIIFVWDDDDIYLPHRIRYSIERLDPVLGHFKPTSAFVLNGETVCGPAQNIFHSGGCWTRELFDKVHGYRHMGSGQDTELEKAFEKQVGRSLKVDVVAAELYYLYRWSGSSSYHLSRFGRDREGKPRGVMRVEEFVARQMSRGEVPTGECKLTPRWRLDYTSLVRQYLQDGSKIHVNWSVCD